MTAVVSASQAVASGDAPVAVIGGGLAGLTAALDLVEAGLPTVLFERRPFPGGKAYSFRDPNFEITLDNGQHITMRCCTAFQGLLDRLELGRLVSYQDELYVPVIDPFARGRRLSAIAARQPPLLRYLTNSAAPVTAPLHLAWSILTYAHLSAEEKARLGLAMDRIRRLSEAERRTLDRQTFAEWLSANGQTARMIQRIWDLIVLPTCNDRSADVSAAQAIQVFQVGFLTKPRAGDIGLFRGGLSVVSDHALAAFRQLGGDARLTTPVHQIGTDGSRAVHVSYGSNGQQQQISAAVLALPPQHALPLLPRGWRQREPFWRFERHQTSPIVNVHMQWDRTVMLGDFAAVLDPHVQFVFNRSRLHGISGPSHWVSVSISGAHEIIDDPQQAIVDRAEAGLRRALKRARSAKLLAARVVKEREATFRPLPGMAAHRPKPRTPIRNLALAGAWTDTGWPATMESAVRSGHAAAETILEQLGASS